MRFQPLMTVLCPQVLLIACDELDDDGGGEEVGEHELNR
jgi:hypothetical protein